MLECPHSGGVGAGTGENAYSLCKTSTSEGIHLQRIFGSQCVRSVSACTP